MLPPDHAAFMQALGWATLNSFWQMALLWCLYVAANHTLNLTSEIKYRLAIIAIITGFAWFIFSFFQYYLHSSNHPFFFSAGIFSQNLVNEIISDAAIAYLGILIFPAYRLFKSWQHIQQLKKGKSHKAAWSYRLFVQKIAHQLGLKKQVQIYVSELVRSPLTIGYIRPVILMPVAVLNNLSIAQVEAILLHELSHIKRHDYLINLLVAVIRTLLYFNPFVQLLMRHVEEEREKCCDAVVLQFQYDKISYASALLILEKYTQTLTMAAVGKKHLLHRIEKIIGIEKKPTFKLQQAVGILGILLLALLINAALLMMGKQTNPDSGIAFTNFAHPFYVADPNVFTPVENDVQLRYQKAKAMQTFTQSGNNRNATEKSPLKILVAASAIKPPSRPDDVIPPPPPPDDNIIKVFYKVTDAPLSNAQKEQVEHTVVTTKKVLEKLQWKEVEKSIADAMTNNEKQLARRQYEAEVAKINWKKIESNLKAAYDSIDWNGINIKLNIALNTIKLDSIRDVYSNIVAATENVKAQANNACILPYPDISVNQIKQIRKAAQKRLQLIKAIGDKKIIRL